MSTRTLRVLLDADIARIAAIYHAWRSMDHGAEFVDIPGLAKSASVAEITENDFVLTPGRYVGAEDSEDDGEPIEEKLRKLEVALLAEFDEGRRLENIIRERIRGLHV